MQRSLRLALLAITIAFGLGAPAAAQFSDSYNFIKAVKDKDAGKAQELLDKPGTTVINVRDPETGETALHIVARRNDATWLGFLLQRGAEINARDKSGNTALMLAAQGRWPDGVQVLLTVRAQFDLQNRLGETALQNAVQNRDANTAKLLIDAGANPDITDNSGVSARSLAVSDPRAAPIARLLKDVPIRKPKPAQGPSL